MSRVFSGIQPTSSSLHLGNYLGALRNFVTLQDKYDCIFCVVDQHAITVAQNPSDLRKNILSTAAAYLACGIDPERSVMFQQSAIYEHACLQWVLMTLTNMGHLNRMTQFKAKTGISQEDKLERYSRFAFEMSQSSVEDQLKLIEEFENKQSDGIGVGLYTYPVLMAADILLYKATHVPVGDDQKQHLQLARQIAKTFNDRYGETFPIPEPIINETGARIMSLRYPDRKMSKSNMDSEEEVIFLTDSSDQIAKKIKRATSDSDMLPYEANGLEGRLGAKNLVTIYAMLNYITLDEACQNLGGKGFGNLKKELTDTLVETIVPIGNKMFDLLENPDQIQLALDYGADDVLEIVETNIDEVYRAVGFR